MKREASNIEPSFPAEKKANKDVHNKVERHVPFIKEQLVALIQTAICVILVVTALVLKTIGGSFYAWIATWYFDRVNDSIFVTENKPEIPFKEEITVSEISRIAFPDGLADNASETDKESDRENSISEGNKNEVTLPESNNAEGSETSGNTDNEISGVLTGAEPEKTTALVLLTEPFSFIEGTAKESI